jgi:hypothetical protein
MATTSDTSNTADARKHVDMLVMYLDVLGREWASTSEEDRIAAVRLASTAARRARRLLGSGQQTRGLDDGDEA